jgi:hypothetical protein
MAGEGRKNSNFIVKKDDWSQCRNVAAEVGNLESGQVLLRVDRFAFTSNNISYALAGDMLDYWGFFPAEDGWGRLPVMGFGDVAESKHDQVKPGERVFGFFPMSNYLKIQADKVNAAGFIDASPHRANHAAAYVQFTSTANDPMYEAGFEDQLMLLRGLFMTSYLADDFIADNDFFGARSVVVTSASSKTAIALAFLLARRPGLEAIGLTSERNLDFVKGLGLYDQVIPYDLVGSLPGEVPTVVVDMAGDGSVTSALHHHFGAQLKHDCTIGATHWDQGRALGELPGATPEFFFAPTLMQKRSQEWGPGGLQKRLAGAWREFRISTGDWLQVVRSWGASSVEQVYRTILEGRAHPNQGHVLSPWDG